MSRCFPYPPPGYVRNGACGEALIESIKLQREKEKAAKGRRKEKKESKKEKRERRQRRNEKLPGICHGKRLSDKKSLKGEADLNGGYLQKSKDDEVEQLEKSSVTEEHEQTICSKNASESSDSTHNSYKRKRQQIHNHGNIIRIRLPSQKHNGPDASVSKEHICSTSERHKGPDASVSKQHICSTSGRTDFLPQPEIAAKITTQQGSVSTKRAAVAHELAHTSQASAKTRVSAHNGVKPASGSSRFINERQTAESLYSVLIENWVPTLIQHEDDFGDQDWLFETKRQGGNGAKRCKASSNALCHQSLTSWSHARYLPEADIYALPFTVPF